MNAERMWRGAALLTCGVAAVSAALHSRMDWDVLAYVGCSFELAGLSAEDLHARTFAAVNAEATLEERNALARPDGYRDVMVHDPHAFAEQLPFYRHRVLYVAVIHLGALIGLNPARAALLVSNLALLIFGLALYSWLLRSLVPPVALAASLVLSATAWPVATDGSPDMLAAALLVSAYSAAMAGRRGLFLAAALAAVLTRGDAAILLLPTLAVPLLSPPRLRLLLSVALPLLASTLYVVSGGYPWPVVEHHTFVEPLAHPASFARTFGLTEYLETLATVPRRMLQSLMSSTFLVAFAVFGLGRTHPKLRRLVGYVWGATLIRLLIHPDVSVRFLIAPFAITLVLSIEMLAVWWSEIRSPAR